jgi:hypothetical protein
VEGLVCKDDFVKAIKSLDYFLVKLADKQGTSLTRELKEERYRRLNTISSKFNIL